MVVSTVAKTDDFVKAYTKIRDSHMKEKIKKQIMKIVGDPEIGKPMRFARKNTREVYVSPFRLSYAYLPDEEKLIFLVLYHKDEQ